MDLIHKVLGTLKHVLLKLSIMLICGVLGKTFHLWFDYFINVQWIERIVLLLNMSKSNKGFLGEANNTICQQKCE
jgi:hypothetical protein